jgi:hypothetical protein
MKKIYTHSAGLTWYMAPEITVWSGNPSIWVWQGACSAGSVEAAMSQFTRLACLLSLAIAISVSALPISAQESQPVKTVLSGAEGSAPAELKPASISRRSAVRTFQGTIRRSQDGYILKDCTGASYDLDNQIRVRDFDGQNVTLRGTLNQSSSSIRVKSIEPSD